jgi:hypothetical protein
MRKPDLRKGGFIRRVLVSGRMNPPFRPGWNGQAGLFGLGGTANLAVLVGDPPTSQVRGESPAGRGKYFGFVCWVP